MKPEMKTYIGTKTVRACKMNRKEYNDLRGWEVPKDENPEDEGYLVEYINSSKPNVEGFEGYVSWSPVDVFEETYITVEASEDRVLMELEELKKKVNFLNGLLGKLEVSEEYLRTKEQIDRFFKKIN